MNTNAITITVFDENDEITMGLPSCKCVCPKCQGDGSILTPSIGDHAYSEEDFAVAFHNDNDRAAYFQRGGKYDIQCPKCHGKNVIDVVDVAACTPEQKAHYDAYLAQERKYAAWRRMAEAERAMGA